MTRSKSIAESIYATEGQTAEYLADLKSDEAMTATALDLLKTPSASAYKRALAALRDDIRAWGRSAELGTGRLRPRRDPHFAPTPRASATSCKRRYRLGTMVGWRELENRSS